MKQGRTIQALAQEVQRQTESKRDFVLSTKDVAVGLLEGGIGIGFQTKRGREDFAMSPTFHQQLAIHTKVPQAFYDRMLQGHPDILADTLTKLLQREPAPRLLRTLDGNARAFLSNAYRRIDNVDVLEAILPVIGGIPSASVASCEVTEHRLHLKIVVDEVRGWADYKKPGTHERIRQEVRSGFYVANSEIGRGAYSVRPFCEVLACTNGMIIEEMTQHVRHTGRRMAVDQIAEELMSDRTRQLSDAATLSQTRDLVAAAINPKKFAELCDRMSKAGEEPITRDVTEVIELTAKEVGLREGEKSSVLEHLIRGGDLSRWGVTNAITRTAQDAESYDRATELESIGGRMLAMDPAEWRKIASN